MSKAYINWRVFMYKVILDTMGGDNSPYAQVEGAVIAVNKDKDLHVVLTGNEEIINAELTKYSYDSSQISIINATDVITNDDTPTIAIKQKTESSLVKAFDELRLNDEIVGLVSNGSTGAVLTGGFLKVGRIKGVSRPALCPIIPTKTGSIVCICDCGANMDSKPINLVHFALMANAYLKNVFVVKNPRVALLSVGTEDHKGNELVKQVLPVLKGLDNINFVGNMEARDLLSGDYDIVVTDGFAGNVLLKSTEGSIMAVLSMLKQEIKSSFVSKIGALFMKKSFKNLKGKMDYNNQGGAVLLGTKKIVVKGHGNSKPTSVSECIKQVVEMHKADVCGIISKEVSEVKIDIDEE